MVYMGRRLAQEKIVRMGERDTERKVDCVRNAWVLYVYQETCLKVTMNAEIASSRVNWLVADVHQDVES